MFWRNEGGFSVLLREIVLWSFYPGLALALVTTSGFTVWSVRLAKRSSAAGYLGLVILATEWMCVVATLCIFLANNLENILRGLPLHSHP